MSFLEKKTRLEPHEVEEGIAMPLQQVHGFLVSFSLIKLLIFRQVFGQTNLSTFQDATGKSNENFMGVLVPLDSRLTKVL